MTSCSAGKKPAAARDTNPRGGTLRVVEPRDISTISTEDPKSTALDPQMEYSYDSWELLRCCLLRTLLSHSGHPTDQGGANLQPDLAVKMPDVSADGMTWTFKIRRGIHYGPPLANVTVSAQDFVRALQREARIGKDFYSFYFDPIRGFEDYASGKSDSISGLETPDAQTLVIHLTQPTGDLGYRLVLPGTAPIPPSPADPSSPFGVAAGHDESGYGKYLVSTGPYMVEGADKLNFSLPAKQQPSLLGLSPGKLITLVRNPSWSATADPLRAGYPDRIEIRFPEGDQTAIAKLATTGASDVDLDYQPPIRSTLALAASVRSSPTQGSVFVGSRDFVRYVSMNLAVPPFDDIHVRRAVNFAINKARIQALDGGPFAGTIAGHTAFDSMENNLLVAYNPFKTPGNTGSVDLARQEMAQSRYDKNHDGICDAAACKNIVGLTIANPMLPLFVPIGEEIAHDLLPIGLGVRSTPKNPGMVFGTLSDPKKHAALALTTGWGKDFLNASNFIVPLFSRDQIGKSSGANYSLLGATPQELAGWGYSVHSVPSIDDRITQCLRIQGAGETQCWTTLDQYITERVVPWAPLLFESKVLILSTRVVAFSFDQFANLASLDRIALKPGS